MANPQTQIPRPGMCATVRNRRGIITAVDPFDGDSGRLHLVNVEYKDDQFPVQEQLIWELEPHRKLLEPNALPSISSDPMIEADYDALLRSVRWTASLPYSDSIDNGSSKRVRISGPFHSAVQIEDFQLVPLLKAMRMPRVNLLIADDVGLGKTVEAGLILTELLLRRRIQRVLILTPASLRYQWRDEMWDKFSLRFDLIDRNETQRLRKSMGMDANPWRAHSRIIASYHYLKQPDVLEQFLSACQMPEGSPHLPWDLLIVDECHNLMPSAFGQDSDLCEMLRHLASKFEHKLFLSATPHNGHTRCFSGLLEILDPVSFTQTSELKDAEKERISQVVIRRLKREINERTVPAKFSNRNQPMGLALTLSKEEEALSEAFHEFRSKVYYSVTADMFGNSLKRRRAQSFAVEILGKRLLSCPVAFADSWRRCLEGMREDAVAGEQEVITARNEIEGGAGDDRETQSRELVASTVIGAWLKNLDVDLSSEIDAIDQALERLGFDINCAESVAQIPITDARFDALISLIESLLRENGEWKADERLVVFTEYKTTLDYVTRRLNERFAEERILNLFGGMDDKQRDEIKQLFNDPVSSVRILVATDAAAEGLNLQRTARFMLHYDCPWNPSKLEQRNGRIDRHGQARDVTIYHFVSEQNHDLAFLSHVIKKADEIREDLGSANELFDEAAHRRLIDGESAAQVEGDLDRRLEIARKRASFKADNSIKLDEEGQAATEYLKAAASELDLDSESLCTTLESAMAIRGGRPQLEQFQVSGFKFQVGSPEPKLWKIKNPGLPGWTEVIDDSLRRNTMHGVPGPVKRLAFDPEALMHEIGGGRRIFLPQTDVSLLHLSHPMIQHALSALTRRRYPGIGNEVSRWIVSKGYVPDGIDALIFLNIEELAVNDLRETFHHWVSTVILPVKNDTLGKPLSHISAATFRDAERVIEPNLIDHAREIFDDVEGDLKNYIASHSELLSSMLKSRLEVDYKDAREREDKSFRSRQGEISNLINENTISKLEREITELKEERKQGVLFDEQGYLEQLDHSIKEKQDEIARRLKHYQSIQEQLKKERERIMTHLLPLRYSMTANTQVFPVSIEIRMP